MFIFTEIFTVFSPILTYGYFLVLKIGVKLGLGLMVLRKNRENCKEGHHVRPQFTEFTRTQCKGMDIFRKYLEEGEKTDLIDFISFCLLTEDVHRSPLP